MTNEKRLIDANALKQKMQDHHDFFVDAVGGFRYLTPKEKARVDEITHCIAEIVNAPTVDAVEVVHGRWKYYHKQNIAVCTNCSFERDLSANFGKAISCPNCGAHMMDGGNEDGRSG